MSRTASRLFPLLLALLPACADTPTISGPAEARAGANGGKVRAAAASLAVVMSNLDNPRGLAWGPEGGLYVAEAGSPVVNGPCAPIARGENCYSGTGAISRL